MCILYLLCYYNKENLLSELNKTLKVRKTSYYFYDDDDDHHNHNHYLFILLQSDRIIVNIMCFCYRFGKSL